MIQSKKLGFSPVAVLIAIAAFALLGSIAYYYALPQAWTKNDQTGEGSSGVMMEKGKGMPVPDERNTVMEKEVIVVEEGTMNYAGTVIAGESSPLLDFKKADYDKALKSEKLIVLYFYANWCPICKEETANALYPAFNELTTERVVGFRVNYNDSETDENEKVLAREFGVAYQHTKVFVKNGARVLKAPDSWAKDRYLTEINTALK